MQLKKILKHFTEKQLLNIEENGLYIVSDKKIFQACYSSAQNQVYFMDLKADITFNKQLTKKTEYRLLNYKDINKLLNYNYLIA